MSNPDINRFSFSRLDLVWAFYEPGIKRYLLWALIIVMVGFAFSFISYHINSTNLFSISSFIVGLPALFGATAFTFYQDRTLTCQLPATAAERFIFILLFTFIVVPVSVMMIWLGLDGIAVLCGSDEIIFNSYKRLLAECNEKAPFLTTELSSLSSRFSPWMRILTDNFPASVALYLVIACNKQRFMKAVAGVVVVNVLIGLASGIYAIYNMVSLFKDSEGIIPEDRLGELIATNITDLIFFLHFLSPALSLIVIFFAWRKIKSVQV